MEDGPPIFPPGFTCPAVLWIQLAAFSFRLRDYHSLWCAVPCTSAKIPQCRLLSVPRRYCYLRFGLFRVRSPLLTESRLISFPRPNGSRRIPIYSVYVAWLLTMRVSPFGYPRIKACFRLPVAFRRSLRPSSAPGAKAFPLRSL